MQIATTIVATLDSVSEIDSHNGIPYGIRTIKVIVQDGENNSISGAPITMTIDGVSIDKTLDTKATLQKDDKDYYTKFDYNPTTTGDKTAVFTSGDITQEFDFTVDAPMAAKKTVKKTAAKKKR